MSKKPITGELTLFSKSKAISDGGLNGKRHRFEFTLSPESNENWIVETEVLGPLPWLKGESRIVKVRVMTNEFENALIQTKKPVFVYVGAYPAGTFELL